MEYKTITVTKPRFGIGRILCLLVGLFLLASALLVSLTIIGIFAGAVLLIISLPFFAAAKGGARFTCPNCGYERNGVANGKVNASCKRCRQNIAVTWIDKSTKNSESLS